MKKKLLVVLLLVVMVFALVACNPSDDSEWNYFSSVYSSLKDEKVIKLQTMGYAQLQSMYTTAGGKFLVWFGSASDAGSKNSVKEVNDLAKEYDVPVIYNFDPVLDGGYAKTAKAGGYKTRISSGTDTYYDYITDLGNSGIKNVNVRLDALRSEILAVFGMTAIPMNKLVYFEGYALDANLTLTSEFKDAIRIEGNSYEVRTGVGQKENKVFTKEMVVQSSCNTVPNRGDKVGASAYKSVVTPHYYFSDADFNIVDADKDGNSQYLKNDGSVFQYVTYHEFMAMLGAINDVDGIKGDFLVHFGGVWCPNTQAMAWRCNAWAKDYGIEKIYFYDPMLDNGTTDYRYHLTEFYTNIRTHDSTTNTTDYKTSFSYTALYADLLQALGGKFTSSWNTKEFTDNYYIKYDTNNTKYTGVKVAVTGADEGNWLPRMCVPNLMLINNKNDGKNGKIIDKIECEYEYDDIKVDDNPLRMILDEALSALIEQHEDAYYNPVVVAASSSTGDAPAASGGGDGC